MPDEKPPRFPDRIANDDGDIEVLFTPEDPDEFAAKVAAYLAELCKSHGTAEPDEEDVEPEKGE